MDAPVRPRGILTSLLEAPPRITVVDVGASPFEGPAPYRTLLDMDVAQVFGFDPNLDAMRQLDAAKGRNETYLPYAVGDGTERTIHVCAAPGMTSLLEPNAAVLNMFSDFPEWGRVIARSPVQTIRLDDVVELERMDYLKMDIQGAELLVLQHAPRLLSTCLFAQLEALFLPMYCDQPLFSEVEQFMRSSGFWLHKFFPTQSCILRPLPNNVPFGGNLGQLFWCDALFVRSLTSLEQLPAADLLKLAIIASDVYASYDLAVRCLAIYEGQRGSKLLQPFLAALSARSATR